MTTFVRFVVPSRIDADSGVARGVVHFAHDLVDAVTDAELRAEMRAALAWLDEHLAVPDRFNRTKSKGWYRRKTRGISWLRVSAVEHFATLERLANVVRRCGYQVAEIRTSRPGYVTYEDDLQVVAEPFRETPTR